MMMESTADIGDEALSQLYPPATFA
jgi:hypothetical protein